MTTKITDDRVLAVLVEFIEVEGYQPSMRQMAQRLDVVPSTVHDHYLSLEAAGRIERVPGQPRAIKIMEAL
jgi:repressor LexA